MDVKRGQVWREVGRTRFIKVYGLREGKRVEVKTVFPEGAGWRLGSRTKLSYIQLSRFGVDFIYIGQI